MQRMKVGPRLIFALSAGNTVFRETLLSDSAVVRTAPRRRTFRRRGAERPPARSGAGVPDGPVHGRDDGLERGHARVRRRCRCPTARAPPRRIRRRRRPGRCRPRTARVRCSPARGRPRRLRRRMLSSAAMGPLPVPVRRTWPPSTFSVAVSVMAPSSSVSVLTDPARSGPTVRRPSRRAGIRPGRPARAGRR